MELPLWMKCAMQIYCLSLPNCLSGCTQRAFWYFYLSDFCIVISFQVMYFKCLHCHCSSFSSVWRFVLFQVAGLFQDASIGNAINIAVVRIILLERDEVRISTLKQSISFVFYYFKVNLHLFSCKNLMIALFICCHKQALLIFKHWHFPTVTLVTLIRSVLAYWSATKTE